MLSQRASISGRVVRFLNRLGFVAAVFLALAIPSAYALFSISTAQNALELETSQAVRALDQIVMDRPDLWEYETLRIQELIDRPTFQGVLEDREVRDSNGRLLVRSASQASSPFIHCAVTIHDSGRVVGYIEARRSIRAILFQTAAVALLSAILAAGLFIIFRLLPIRVLGRALTELSEERMKVAATLRAIPDGIIAADGNDRVVFLNPAAEWVLGCSSEFAAGKALPEIYPVHRPSTSEQSAGQNRAELRVPGESARIIEERFSPLPVEWSGRAGRVIVFRDITNQLKTEEELLRVRQIESLGVLAGGIAHDFNNYLSAILGNISLAKQDLPLGGRPSERLAEAMKATDRARALSLKLLTFAKGGDPARKVVDLATLVRESAEFAIHGTSARFTCAFEPGLWNAEVDDGLLSQVIHNLVINAVQAMQGQGLIQIRIENLVLDADEILQMEAGRYLRVSIHDSGPGIPKAILPRIFEPYFTTKTTGNGLGLASCFNIMKAHGGNILAESGPEGGATFLLYVPATDKPLDTSPAVLPAASTHERGWILVMEDDPVLQEIATEMLERSGFLVQACADGDSAIRLYSQAMADGMPFYAAIMDLTIPGGMGGREAAARILELDPKARLIVSSGYSVDPVMAHPQDFGFKGVLPKPYSLADLARVMDAVCANSL